MDSDDLIAIGIFILLISISLGILRIVFWVLQMDKTVLIKQYFREDSDE